MGKLIGCLLKELIGFPISILLAPLIYSFVYEAYLFLVSSIKLSSIIWFICGSFLYVLVYILIFLIGGALPYTIFFLEHLEHELGHSIAGFIFLRGTRKLIANPGWKHEDGEQSQVVFLDSSYAPNFLIRLAPYYFPVFTIPLLIAEPLASFPLREIIDFLIGFTLAFHFVGLRREFGLKQETDIAPYGLSFPFCITCLLNTILLIIAICVVSRNYLGILNYFESSIARTPESYQAALQTLTILMQQQ
jgi:hypothetical protein